MNKAGTRAVLAVLIVLLILGAALRLRGIDVSLWLDEAWVANSIFADSLAGVFFYKSWLQTTPPIFLMLVRWGVQAFGTSNASFRLLPWLFGVAALICFCLLARKILSPWLSVLATSLFVFSPLAADYSRELKQYTAELFCATILLALAWAGWSRDRPLRLRLVLPVLFATPLLAYGTVFLLPGLMMSQLRPFPAAEARARWVSGSVRRGLAMIAATGASGAVVFHVVQRNTSPLLGEFWFGSSPIDPGAWLLGLDVRLCLLLSLLPGLDGFLVHAAGRIAAILLFAGIVAWGLIMTSHASPVRRREAFVVAGLCGFPIVTMLAADLLHLYPWMDRTCLLLLPALVILIAHSLDTMCGRGVQGGNPSLQFLVAALSTPLFTFLVGLGVEREMQRRIAPQEDAAGAVTFLESRVGSGDLVYVHASMRETFKLYSRLRAWRPAGLLMGETGWPCCPRGMTRQESAQGLLDRHDLSRLVPAGFHGRVWVLVTGRPYHWEYLGVDERPQMRRDMNALGCGAPSEHLFESVRVFAFTC